MPVPYDMQVSQHFADLVRQGADKMALSDAEQKLSQYLSPYLNPSLATTPAEQAGRLPELQPLFAPHEWQALKKYRPDVIMGDSLAKATTDLDKGRLPQAAYRLSTAGMKPDQILDELSNYKMGSVTQKLDSILGGVQTKEEFNRLLATHTSGLSPELRSRVITQYGSLGSQLKTADDLADSMAGELQASVMDAMRDQPLSRLDNVMFDATRSPEMMKLDPYTLGLVKKKFSLNRSSMLQTIKATKDAEALDAVDPWMTELSDRLAVAQTPAEKRTAYRAVESLIKTTVERQAFRKHGSKLLAASLTESKQAQKDKDYSFKQTMDIREQSMNDPAYKTYAIVSQQADRMRRALHAAKTDKSKLIAADQVLVTTFNKITDPPSVVMVSEWARTAENAAILHRLEAIGPQIMNGGLRLIDSDREALANLAFQMENTAKRRYDDFVVSQRALAERFGADPEFAIPSISDRSTTVKTRAEEFLKSKGMR